MHNYAVIVSPIQKKLDFGTMSGDPINPMDIVTDARAERWICAQIGARQRYFVPRSLASLGALELLLTDAWFPPHHPLARTSRIAARFNDALADADVWAPNVRTLAMEAWSRVQRDDSIARMMRRNQLFQRVALQRLRAVRGEHRRTLLGFSYASRDLFAYARSRGWRTVLDQIDLGPLEQEIVRRLDGGEATPLWPPAYWSAWRQETELADVIVVNSTWTRQAMIDQGVPDEKLRLIPLAYDGPLSPRVDRQYPAKFDAKRPMRVLFLGQIIPRKGIVPLFEAIRQLDPSVPIVLDLVGPVQMPIPADIANDPRVTLVGATAHTAVLPFFEQADVFILPTFSDGFAVTQIEARAMCLPVIASRFCGDVVRDGENGLLLAEVTPAAITQALMRCVNDSAGLARMAMAKENLGSENTIGQMWLDVFDD